MAGPRKKQLAALKREVLAELDSHVKLKEKKQNGPYDGVLGSLPVWMPQSLADDFEIARTTLLYDYSPEQVLGWISAFANTSKLRIEQGHVFHPDVPANVWDEITTLSYVRYIVSLGERDGIKEFISSTAAIRYERALIKNRAQNAARKPRTDELAKLILEIIRARPTITSPQLLNELKKRKGGGVIEDVDEEDIAWKDKRGHGKSTPISALKDRVSRAKRIIESR